MAGFNLSDAQDLIAELARQRIPVDAGMQKLIDFCRARFPQDVWKPYEEFDYETDVRLIKGWLTHLLQHEPPEPEIKALWFGLYFPVEDARVTCALYVSGYRSFHTDSGPGDWDQRNRYWADGRYAISLFLESLHDRAYRPGGPGNLVEFTLGLGFSALAVTRIVSEIEPHLLLGDCPDRQMAITCGFDEGGCLFLGMRTKSGLEPIDEKCHAKPKPPEDPDTGLYEIVVPRTGRWWLQDIRNADGTHLAGGFAETGELESPSQGLIARIRDKEFMTDINFPVLGPPVMRQSIARELASRATGGVQLLPVRVEGNDESWDIMNITPFVSWEVIRAQAPDDAKSPWLSEFQDRKIFRAGKYPGPIAIIRPLKERLERQNLTGLSFQPLGRASPWRYLGMTAWMESRKKTGLIG